MSSSATENDEENHFDLHSQDDDALDQPILKNSKSPSSSSCSSTQMKSQSHQPNVGFGLDNQRINMTTFISRMSKPARKPTLSLIAAIEAIAPGSVLSSANPASRRSSGTALPITPASFSSTVDSVTPNNKLLIQQPSTSSVLMSKQPSASSPSKSRQQSHQQSTNQSSSIERPPRVDTSPPRIAIDVKPPAIYGGYLFKHGHFNYIRRYMVLEAGALKIYTDESKREFKNELLLYLYTLVIGNTVEEDNCASSKPSSGGGRYRNYSDDRGSSFSLSLTHQSFSTISGHIGTTTKQTSPLPKIYKTDLVLLGRVPTVSSVELQCLDTDALPKWVELLQQHIFYSMSTHHSAAAVKARTVSRQLRQSVESDSDVASQIDLPHYNTNTTEQMTQAISKFNQDFTRSGSGLFTEGGNKLPSFGTMSEKTGDGDEDEDEDTHNNRLIAERSKHSNHALEPPSSDVMNPILMGARRRFSLKNDGNVLNSDKTPVGSLDESISLFDYPPLTQGRVILRNAWWVFSSWTSRYIVLEMGILRIYKRKCTEYPFGEELDMEIPIYNCSVKSATFDSSQILMYIFLQSKNERSIFALPTRSITLKAISESFVDENNRYSGHMGHPTTSSQDWLKRFKQSMNFYNNSHQLRSIS